MLANTCNPGTQEMEQEDPELQASRGYIPKPCGAREGRRKMKERGEEGEKEGKRKRKRMAWREVFGYDEHVFKDLKAQDCLTMDCKLQNCSQHLLIY